MKSNSLIFFFFLFAFVCTQKTVFSQQDLSAQLTKETKYMYHDIYDERYGITMYERLNMRLGGDSVRLCKGYACSGWIEDYYNTGAPVHKGYYVEGQLKIYKNFYMNGKIEREFRTIDDYKSNLRVYFPNGTLKSETNYMGKEALEWTDYYENGQIEYYELYDKSFNFYLAQKSNYEDGTPSMTLELKDKKKLIFIKKEYYPNGKVKTEGEVIYNVDLFDYQKNGKWLHYSEEGILTTEETFVRGELNKSKKL